MSTIKTTPGWSPPAFLPNQEGFKFEAKKKTGEVVKAEVTVYGPNKLHTVKGVHYKDILEWRNIQQT